MKIEISSLSKALFKPNMCYDFDDTPCKICTAILAIKPAAHVLEHDTCCANVLNLSVEWERDAIIHSFYIFESDRNYKTYYEINSPHFEAPEVLGGGTFPDLPSVITEYQKSYSGLFIKSAVKT